MKSKLRNLKRKELKKNFIAQAQTQGRLNTLCVKRKVWHCESCGDQIDHSTRICPKVLAERSNTDPKKRTTGSTLNRILDIKEEKADEEVNLTQAQARRKVDFGTYSVSIDVNIAESIMITKKKSVDSGSSANVVNKFMRHLIRL